jgi:hypothetical protein
MYANTNSTRLQVEAPSLETSKFSLYFSDSCIPINPKLSYIFPPEFLVVFNRFQCKKYQISTIISKYFVYILQQLSIMRRTHVGNLTWINSISPELCPPLTCERACSGNEIDISSEALSFKFTNIYQYLILHKGRRELYSEEHLGYSYK